LPSLLLIFITTTITTTSSSFRGLCTVIRSEAGEVPGQDKSEDRNYRNNQHLFDVLGSDDLSNVLGGPSKHVGYYDAASLYPSSGTRLQTPRLTPRGARRGIPCARAAAQGAAMGLAQVLRLPFFACCRIV